MTTTYKLLPFQQVSADKMVRDGSHFLFYQMGLGKTPTTTVAGYNSQQSTWLILCPKNSIRTWEDHITGWFRGLDATIVRTTPFSIWRWRKRHQDAQARHALWRNHTPNAVNIYIMTYAGYVRDAAVFPHQPDIIICDEAKRLRNQKSKIFTLLKPLARSAKHFWPLTGTPGWAPYHTWTMFHLSNPNYFRSYWKFVNTFHYMQTNEFGRKEILGMRNQEAWNQLLRQRASVVTKDMVAAQIGNSFTVQRQLLHVELDDVQAPIYRELDKEMMVATDGKLILAKTTLDKTIKLRQLLVCPKILNPNLPSYGAAVEDFIETRQEFGDGHCVVFTPFAEAIPFIRERIHQAGWTTEALQGGISPDEQHARISRFRANRSTIVCTVDYAESFSLEPASECYFIGYSYDADQNKQAEFRLQRLTTLYPTNAYYYAYEDTYDEYQAEIVCMKHQHAQTTFDIKHVGLKF